MYSAIIYFIKIKHNITCSLARVYVLTLEEGVISFVNTKVTKVNLC
jgi:hypothetical protein